MGRWTPDDHGCIYDETGCFARLTPNKAERLASRHNADIDALTAERDELQRRLDSIKHRLRNRLGEPLVFIDSNDLIAVCDGKMGSTKPKSTPFDHIPSCSRTADYVVLLDDVELDNKGRAIITREHYTQLWKEFEHGV